MGVTTMEAGWTSSHAGKGDHVETAPPNQPLSQDEAVRRKMLGILRVLSESNEPVGARNIAAQLEQWGIGLSERQVRYHLQIMDERGLTVGMGQAGRVLTERGREELDSALVSDKVGFVAARIDRLAYATTFDLEAGEGEVVLNVSLLRAGDLPAALEAMRPVMEAGLSISDLITIAHEGETLGEPVPPGMVAIGTVCSVTLNGILLRHYIAVESKFGGLLELREGRPFRFTELVSYAGTSIDPLQIFITGRLTSAAEAASSGCGKVGAGFREVPAVALPKVAELKDRMQEFGLGGVVALGSPGQPLLDLPVGLDRAGLVVVAGLTPLAAVAEQGIEAVNKAMSATCDFARLRPLAQF